MENPSPHLFSNIKLPPQELRSLSFCGSSRESKVKAWVEALPATRIGYTGIQLYKAVPELERLDVDALTRLHMLESLRPYVQQCVQGLSKSFLNQPLILPEAALKAATVTQALQKHLTNAYLIAARDLSGKIKNAGSKLLLELNLAIHRAITGLGLQLLKTCQLYIPVPAQLWLELHVLYKLAEHFQLLNKLVTDPLLTHSKATSINQAYIRILLFAAARPNQLDQREVDSLYTGLEKWAALASLAPANESANNLFVVNLSADLPPMYKDRCLATSGDDLRELNLQRLLSMLEKQSAAAPQEMTDTMLSHLSSAWSTEQERHFDRHLVQGDLEITVGLSNIHYFLAKGTSFKHFLTNRHGASAYRNSGQAFTAKHQEPAKDPWSDAFDAGGNRMPTNGWTKQKQPKEAPKPPTSPPVYRVNMVDASPGGYCLNWREQIPSSVKAGELLGIREPDRQNWSIGVIRWIRQIRGATQLGIQVLTAQAIPYGASMIQRSGENTDYMRVLMLPALKAVHQPASLLTTGVPFQEHCKVRLNQHGEETLIQLSRKLFSTRSVCQFTFRVLEAPRINPDQQAPERFNSAWD